jgi:sugar/nucleoside kinase (ribokinase family)
LLVTAEECERFAAIPVRARSTVGAGDSMLAGIVLGLSGDWCCAKPCASAWQLERPRSWDQEPSSVGALMSNACTCDVADPDQGGRGTTGPRSARSAGRKNDDFHSRR